MPELYLTDLFRSDLDRLHPIDRRQTNKAIRQISENPRHPGLGAHKENILPNRKIMRARVDNNFRILWEWLKGGDICLWRVAKHSVIDAVNFLPTESNWSMWRRDDNTHQAVQEPDWRPDAQEPQPFRNVPANVLRLFGVPDNQLGALANLGDAEAIWDLDIPENVKYTLYDLLVKRDEWTAKDFLDARHLLYRTTADQLEGYCEGRIKRLLLNLTEEQMAYVRIRANGPVLIKGVAGSGKTTIGLYRAQTGLAPGQFQQTSFITEEDRSVLLLTYSRTLTRALEQLYEELHGETPANVHISTIDGWMTRQLKEFDIRLNAAEPKQRRSLVQKAQRDIAKRYPQDRIVCKRPPDYLLDEIDQVIRARELTSLEEYQAVNRVGRGIGLNRELHRPIMWAIYQRYQELLDKRGLFDWKDLPRLVDMHCPELPVYDVVIVDEAQDLPPSHLHFAASLLKNYEDGRSLTLLADPAQSIYYRGISWKEAGINVQGRTRILARNFRNTQQILAAARNIVDKCDDLKEEDEFIPPTSSHRLGPKPVLARYAYSTDSNKFVANEIVRLCQLGRYRPGDIAILSRGTGLYSHLQKYFRRESIPLIQFRDDDFHILGNSVKYVTMHSAKGLEFPVVFLIGLDDGFVPEIRPESETKQEDEIQERKLFYVSMTRAAERLYMLHPKRNRSRFLYDLDTAAITEREC